MLKKVLYALASFVLGFLLITTVMSITSYSVLMSNITKAIEEKNYVEVTKYSATFSDYEHKFVNGSDSDDGFYVEVYYAIFASLDSYLPETTSESEEGEETKVEPVKYQTLESGIQVMIYDFPEGFKFEDTEAKKGGVSIVFENDEELFFPFNSEDNNYYQYMTYYSFIPVNIAYDEYLSALESNDNLTTDSVIKAIKISDSEDKGCEIPTVGLTFTNELHNISYDKLVEINNREKEISQGKQTESIFGEKYLEIANAVNGKFMIGNTDEVIYSSAEFLVPVIIAAVVFLALDILVAWLIFRKKKPAKYVPLYQQKVQAKPEPEQFSRDVFNVEDYDSEEVTPEEVKNEE